KVMIASIFALFFFSATAFAQTDSVRTNAYGQIVKRYKLSAESRDGILTFESADQKFRTWTDVRVQMDANVFSRDTYNDIGNGVNIRRARLAVKTILYENWKGEIDLDFAGSGVELKDAYIMYDFDNAFVKTGHYKEPFSMEETTTSRYITFMERSLVSKMTPSRHLGFSGSYVGSWWMTTGGVFFNTVGDAEEVLFTQNNNKDSGIDEGYSFTGKIVVNPILKDDMMIHVGLAASHRTPKSHLEVPNSYRFSTLSYSAINRKKYLDTDDILNVENNVLTNVELAGMYKNFMFQTQYIHNRIHREDDLTQINLDGFYVQAGVLLFGSTYAYNQAEGEFTSPKLANDWGSLEFAVRYDYVNTNDGDAFVFGGAAEGYTAGLTWRANTNVKIMLNYSYLKHDRYANGKGKLFIYEDADGVKYTDISGMDIPEGDAGEKFHMIGARVEIDF
ncbi:MAG: hypothetical protein JXA16_05500, partial [Bacteroidales bacterium]|nr:hypothetical protein [Bacteroidales bacterium]